MRVFQSKLAVFCDDSLWMSSPHREYAPLNAVSQRFLPAAA